MSLCVGFTTPPWVHHEGGAIFSLDVNPCFDKIATCGQGPVGGDGLVVIWDSRPIQSEQDSLEGKIPRILAKCQFQCGINVIRWNPEGTKFACGSDNGEVFVWEFRGKVQSAGTIGSKTATNVEKWTCEFTMHAHTMEVLGVEWSMCRRHLATCSMDHTIVVYNAKKLPEKLIVLDEKRKGHTGPVKGISWDPVGTYLASQSSDRSIKLWRTDTWQCDKEITKPFAESCPTTMFTRLSWSPDGQFLLAPCAMNNDGPVCQIVKRQGWDTELDIVGHRKAVTTVRFCDRLFHYKDRKGKVVQVSCVAVGSRDRSISIWVLPHLQRPITVILNLFDHSIMDFAWKGHQLFVCSQDGSIKLLQFGEEALGEMMDMQEMSEICYKLYRTRLPQFVVNRDTHDGDYNESPTKNSFIDTPEAFLAQKKKDALEKGEKEKGAEKESVKEMERKKSVLDKRMEERQQQTEAKTADGKRRIQPLFVSSLNDKEKDNGPPVVGAKSGTEDIKKPVLKRPAVTTITVTPNDGEPTKRRKIASSSHSEGTAASTAGESTTERSETSDSESDEDEEEMEREHRGKGGEKTTEGKSMMSSEFLPPALRRFEPLRVRTVDGSSKVTLPEVKAEFTLNVLGVPSDSVLINNEWIYGAMKCSKLSYTRNSTDQPLWMSIVGPVVISACANRHWSVCGTVDRILRVFSSLSGRLHCSLAMDSVPASIYLNVHKMYTLTQEGFAYTWDLKERKAILIKQSIADCVFDNAEISSVSLCPSGVPLIHFMSGSVYTFSKDFATWVLVDTNASPLLRLFDAISPDEMGDGNIGRVLKKKRRANPLPNISSMIRQTAHEMQLEEWMNSARDAHSQIDYRRLLNTYTRQLVRHKNEVKLKELVVSLSGPSPLIGISRPSLKSDVVGIIQEDTSLSHLLKEETGSVLF